METVYYHLDARRVSTCDMASGETSPRCRSYAVLRKAEEKRADQGGKVLDMAAYRRKLDNSAVGRDDLGAPYDSRDEEERYEATALAPAAPAAAHRARRVRIFGLTMDAFATLAVLVMATVVVLAFLPFL